MGAAAAGEQSTRAEVPRSRAAPASASWPAMVSVVSIVMGSSDGWRCSRIGDPSGGIGPRSSRSRQSIYAISRRVRFESMSATPTELVPRPPRGRVFEGARRVRLGDVSPAGRLRLDAATRYLQDLSADDTRSEEHRSELQPPLRISYA